MKVTGIIAEYNPFHNGHAYQIKMAKEMTHADYVVIVMSGDFTQRGEPAIIDKYARTKMALSSGADLVIELPVVFSTGSAEYFAKGAVSLLNNLNTITHLCFGSECGDIKPLTSIATILSDEPEMYKSLLKENLKSGLSFPEARTKALINLLSEITDIENLTKASNNILGIEYIKALLSFNSNIEPVTVKREGNNYNDPNLSKTYSSALAIRKHIETGLNISLLSEQLPQNTLTILHEEYQKSYPILLNDLSSMLHYKLIMERRKGFADYFDVNEESNDRILNHMDMYTNASDFTLTLKTKDKTYSGISRSLLHILLNIKKKDIETLCQNGYTQYARVLGFRNEAAPLLSHIAQESNIPLIVKPSDFINTDNNLLKCQLQYDLDASCLYRSVAANKFKTSYQNELRRPVLKL